MTSIFWLYILDSKQNKGTVPGPKQKIMEDENEYLKLPVEERCVHKLWKARVSGYEEAFRLFNRFEKEDANDWKKVNVIFILF